MSQRANRTASRILPWVAVLLLLGPPPTRPLRAQERSTAAPTSGRWILDFERDGSIQLTLKRRADAGGHGNWSSSSDYETRDFRGLQRPSGSSEAPARFQMVRDAGTISFEGQLSESGGAGRFSFTASPEYVAALSQMGYRAPDADDLFSLAVHDVSRAFLQELEKLGYKRVPLDDLVSMRIHGATPEFIRELKALGYDRLSVDDLVSMRIHGATPEFIRELKALGYDRLPADDLVSMRIHEVTPEFIRAMRSVGYERLSADDLVSMRIHGQD